MELKSLALLAFVALLLAGAGLFFIAGPATAPSETTARRTPDNLAADDERSFALAETDRSRPRAAADNAESHEGITHPAAFAGDHPWDEQLAKITGRLVESDGTPAAGLTVDLLSASVVTILAEAHSPLGERGFLTGSATSSEDGRFTIDGILGDRMHGLCIDSGGSRSTFRLVEQTPTFGSVTDLGDIVLEPFGTVIGTVIDEDGDPVAGARVRFAKVPDFVMDSGALDMCEDTAVWIGEDSPDLVLDFAGRFTGLLERLPASTGTTAEDGSFRVEGVPLGMVSGGVDKPAHIGAAIPQFELREGEYGVGEVELLFGREITAHVITRSGAPVKSAEVMVGTRHPVLPIGFLRPAGALDKDGRAVVAHLPEDGSPIAIARRNDSGHWTTSSQSSGDLVVVTLNDAAPLHIRVEDSGGAPLSGAVIEAFPSATGFFDSRVTIGGLFSEKPVPPPCVETQPGLYTIDDLTLGQWDLRARVPGAGVGQARIRHAGAVDEIATIVCTAPLELLVRVRDAAQGEAVEHAHVTLVQLDNPPSSGLGSAWTGEDGLAVLSGISTDASTRQGASQWISRQSSFALLCTHPEYGPASLLLESVESPVDVSLHPPSSISGRVTWAGESPGRRYMVVVVGGNEARTRLDQPLFAVTNADGEYRISGLAEGTYEFMLYERFLDENPVALIGKASDPEEIAEFNIELGSGEDLQHDIALDATGVAEPGWFEGRVTLDGQPLAGAEVTFDGHSGTVIASVFSEAGDSGSNSREDTGVTVVTDRHGEFRSPPYSKRGQANITVSTLDVDQNGVATKSVLINAWERHPLGGPTRLNFELYSSTVQIETVDAATDLPLAGVHIRGYGNLNIPRTTTDERGRLEVTFHRTEERVTLMANKDGYTGKSVQLTFPRADPHAPVSIELRKTVLSAGQVLVPASVPSTESPSLMVRDPNAPRHEFQWISTTRGPGGGLTFRTENLPAGEFTVDLYNVDDAAKSVPFTVPEGGAENLVIDMW